MGIDTVMDFLLARALRRPAFIITRILCTIVHKRWKRVPRVNSGEWAKQDSPDWCVAGLYYWVACGLGVSFWRRSYRSRVAYPSNCLRPKNPAYNFGTLNHQTTGRSPESYYLSACAGLPR